MLNAQIMRGADDDPIRGFTVGDFEAATLTYMGSAAGVLPMMGPELSRMPNDTRENVRKYIDMVSDWTRRCYEALSVYEIEG